ncbi:MAG: NAD(P)H-binding protein [Myxococcaceae bacterium]
MKVILFGATGMVGQGVLRECLLSPDVEKVLAVGRSALPEKHAKLNELIHKDMSDFTKVEDALEGYDACFFCLGISSAGMNEADYTRITYDFTLAPAQVLAKRNPQMTFIYVSGAGTDSTEQGRSMWARVKGKTENALFKLPFKAAYMFRPAFIQPMHGIKSKTALYRAVYAVGAPLYPVLKTLFPKAVTTTEQVGRAMIKVAKDGAPKKLLENVDINELAKAG